MYTDGKLYMNFGGLNGSEQAERFRDEFINEATKLGFAISGKNKKVSISFSAETWAPKIGPFIEMLQDLIDRFI